MADVFERGITPATSLPSQDMVEWVVQSVNVLEWMNLGERFENFGVSC